MVLGREGEQNGGGVRVWEGFWKWVGLGVMGVIVVGGMGEGAGGIESEGEIEVGFGFGSGVGMVAGVGIGAGVPETLVSVESLGDREPLCKADRAERMPSRMSIT